MREGRGGTGRGRGARGKRYDVPQRRARMTREWVTRRVHVPVSVTSSEPAHSRNLRMDSVARRTLFHGDPLLWERVYS